MSTKKVDQPDKNPFLKTDDLIRNMLISWAALFAINVVLLSLLAVYTGVADPRILCLALLTTVLATSLAGAPIIRFILVGWYSRYDEFRNLMKDGALLYYLQQFWHELAGKNALLQIDSDKIPDDKKDAVHAAALTLFNRIYAEQYGQSAFFIPTALILVTIALESILLAFIILGSCNTCPIGCAVLCDHRNLLQSIASVGGTYMFVVGDAVMSVRRRTLNISDMYWYALRLALAIPIGIAVRDLPGSMLLAFAFGTLPVDPFLKTLSRVSAKQFNPTEDAQDSDQLVQLEGVTGDISAQLSRDGVGSIDQLMDVDPISLSIRTGLPFKFILRLGSQAVVWRHFGMSAAKLVGIGLADAEPAAALVERLKDPDDTDALAILDEAAARLTTSNAPVTSPSVKAAFQRIASEPYTTFLHKNARAVDFKAA